MQEAFIRAVVLKVAMGVGFYPREVVITTRNSSGGIPAAKASLRNYLRDLDGGREDRPDVLVICMDGDCEGPAERAHEIREMLGTRAAPPCIAIATPDPYVERWYVVQPAAIREALGRGPAAVQVPPRCSHDVFKELLTQTIESTGTPATLGGYEYADLIVAEMNLHGSATSDRSLMSFVDSLRSCLRMLRN